MKTEMCPCGFPNANHMHNQITDTERLNWIIKQHPEIYFGENNYAWLEGRPLRRSIDAEIRGKGYFKKPHGKRR